MSKSKVVFSVEDPDFIGKEDYILSSDDLDNNGNLTPEAKQRLNGFILSRAYYIIQVIEE